MCSPNSAANFDTCINCKKMKPKIVKLDKHKFVIYALRTKYIFLVISLNAMPNF